MAACICASWNAPSRLTSTAKTRMCVRANSCSAALLCCLLWQTAWAGDDALPYRRPGAPPPPAAKPVTAHTAAPTAVSNLSPNAATGLVPVPPPPTDAVYGQQAVDDRWNLPQAFGFVTP